MKTQKDTLALTCVGSSSTGTQSVFIKATVFHIDDGESFNEVEFPTLGGRTETLRIARELFRSPSKVADLLIRANAQLSQPLQAVTAATAQSKAKAPPYFEITRRTGWHNSSSFVYPGETFGELAGKLKLDEMDQIDEALGLRSGSREAWNEGLRKPCKFSDHLILAISVGPASSLLDMISQDEGAIFHFHGTEAKGKAKSSSGKTTATRTGMSTMSRCRKSDLFSFSITERAVEDFCFSHNHLGAALDEESQGTHGGGSTTTVKLVKLPYLIPGGRGKVRSKKATQDRTLRNLTWSEFALSTGEFPLDGRSSGHRNEGQQVRMIGIPVRPGRNGGIFNRVSGSPEEIFKQCKDLIKKLEATIDANYGTIMPEYLRAIVPQRSVLSPRILKIIDGFVRKVGADTEPWERRFAEKFGIVLAAAIFMSEFDLAPWTRKRARLAITRLYKKARAATSTPKDATDSLLKRLRKLVQTGKKFPVIKKGSLSDGKKLWGTLRADGKGNKFLAVRLARFKNLGITSSMRDGVLSELDSRTLLIKSADGKRTKQMMFGGCSARLRYVCLDARFLK